MALSLTPAEANAKVAQIDEGMAQARILAKRLLDRTEDMTATTWLGGKAQTFRAIMQQHDDDFNYIINTMQGIADKGKDDIRTIESHDTQ
jgi:hypothetical protein